MPDVAGTTIHLAAYEGHGGLISNVAFAVWLTEKHVNALLYQHAVARHLHTMLPTEESSPILRLHTDFGVSVVKSSSVYFSKEQDRRVRIISAGNNKDMWHSRSDNITVNISPRVVWWDAVGNHGYVESYGINPLTLSDDKYTCESLQYLSPNPTRPRE